MMPRKLHDWNSPLSVYTETQASNDMPFSDFDANAA